MKPAAGWMLVLWLLPTACNLGSGPLDPLDEDRRDAGWPVDAATDAGGGGADAGTTTEDAGAPDAGAPDAGAPDAASGGTDVDICEQVEVEAAPVAPNVLLVVDKSGSMDEPTAAGGFRTKLQDTRDALNQLIDFGEGRIRFGWMSFPIGGECFPGIVSVDCSLDSVSTIRAFILMLSAQGGTPTGTTLDGVVHYETLHDESRSNFVVLLTDGVPTCPNGNGTTPNGADNQLALNALATLHDRGIDTFVIGLGEDLNYSNPDLLDQMAEIGGRPRAGWPRYYAANSLAELEQAFLSIGEEVISCELALDGVPQKPEWLWVYVDDQLVQRDPQRVNGWDYDATHNQVRFFGPWCDLLRTGGADEVRVEMGCREPF